VGHNSKTNLVLIGEGYDILEKNTKLLIEYTRDENNKLKIPTQYKYRIAINMCAHTIILVVNIVYT